jgi:hypothetical protein
MLKVMGFAMPFFSGAGTCMQDCAISLAVFVVDGCCDNVDIEVS